MTAFSSLPTQSNRLIRKSERCCTWLNRIPSLHEQLQPKPEKNNQKAKNPEPAK